MLYVKLYKFLFIDTTLSLILLKNKEHENWICESRVWNFVIKPTKFVSFDYWK